MRTRIYRMAAIDYLICPKKVRFDRSVEMDFMRASPHFHNREQGGQSDFAVSDNRSSSTVQREHTDVRQLHVCYMHLKSPFTLGLDTVHIAVLYSFPRLLFCAIYDPEPAFKSGDL